MKGFSSIGFFLPLLFSIQIASAAHYTPVYSGNPYNPMSILITGVTVDNLNLEIGDEIGVFDGDVCVGSTSFQGDNMIGISVSMADPTANEIDGFKLGNPIYFRIWKQKTDFEYINVQAHFNFSFDTVFRALGTAIVELKAFIDQQRPKIYPNQLFSVTENASQNTVVGTVQASFPQGGLYFEMLQKEQAYPFKIDSITGVISIANPGLLDYNVTKTYLLPICVYYKKNVELSDTTFCDIDIVRIPPSISGIKNDTAFVGSPYKKVVNITNATSKELFVVPTDVPTWLTIGLKDNHEITFEGTPGDLDIGESKISFLLSDETNNIQQSYILETIQEGNKSNVILSNNPTSGPFTLFINQCKSDEIDVIVRRLDGNIVYRNVLKNTGSSLILPVDLSGNVMATYLVEVKCGNYIVSKKLVLQ
jgi:hypothetical protein